MTRMRQYVINHTYHQAQGLRPYLVRWEDEDRGWREQSVLAFSPDLARDMVEDLTGPLASVQVYTL